MAQRQKRKSIIGQVNVSSYLLMLILTLPVLLSVLLMVLYAARYDASLSRMEIIASLKPMIDHEISDELWSTISGRMTFQRAFMAGSMKMKGDFRVLRTLDMLYNFSKAS